MQEDSFPKIALSTHLLAYHVFQPEIIPIIREFGFSTIEVWCMQPHFAYRDPQYLKRFKQTLDASHVRARSVHLPFYLHLELMRKGEKLSPLDSNPQIREISLRECEQALEAAAFIGAEVAVLHLGEPGDLNSSDNRLRAVKAVQRLGEKAASKKITLSLENIISELTAVENLKKLIEEVAFPNLGICLDVGHSNVFASPIEDLRKISTLLKNSHIHDNDGSSDQHRPPSQGSINWRELMSEFQKLGYSGWHNLEIRDNSRGERSPGELLEKAASDTANVFPV